MRKDQRSPEAKAYRKLYSLPIWRGKGGLRAQQLTKQPLCERCKAKGYVVVATVVNHKQAHKGDWSLFADPSNLQSVCQPCHDGDIQSEERIGYSKAVWLDGFPSDEKHPFNLRAKGIK